MAIRFNQYRKERGHVFQGGYQSILLEDVSVLSGVVDYIHLNPVRAKIVPASLVMNYRWSSLPRYIKGGRFPQLIAFDWLTFLGLDDSAQ